MDALTLTLVSQPRGPCTIDLRDHRFPAVLRPELMEEVFPGAVRLSNSDKTGCYPKKEMREIG